MDIELAILWLMLIFIAVGFAYWSWWLWCSTKNNLTTLVNRQSELKKVYEEKKKDGTLPKSFLPVSKIFEFMNDNALNDSQLLFFAILDETENYKLGFSSSDLIRWMNSYVLISSAVIMLRKPSKILIFSVSVLSFCMFIYSFYWTFLLILLIAVITWIHFYQAGRMELAFSKYLSGTAKIEAQEKAQNAKSSIALELQRLSDLRANGAITDEEFSLLKKKLIND